MSPKKSNIKHLRFELTTKQYSDFWAAVSILEENDKTSAFLKMIDIVLKRSG